MWICYVHANTPVCACNKSIIMGIVEILPVCWMYIGYFLLYTVVVGHMLMQLKSRFCGGSWRICFSVTVDSMYRVWANANTTECVCV